MTGESLNMSYLTPYLQSVRPNFKKGANFAISGASTLPKNVLFSLSTQVLQFVRFLQLQSQGNIYYKDSSIQLILLTLK